MGGMFAVVDGEYSGYLEDFYVAIRKLHPDVKRPSQSNPWVYVINETIGGRPLRITITVTPGRTFVGGDPCYDVYMQGSSINGDCKPFIDRIVEEVQLNVMPKGESRVIREGTTSSVRLEHVVALQIEEIMTRQRF